MLAVVIVFCVSVGGCVLLAMIGSLLPHRSGTESTPPSVAFDPTAPDYQSGYSAGKQMGLNHASFGLGMPIPFALQRFSETARKKSPTVNAAKWDEGFKNGFQDGFNEAKRTNRPETANASQYEQKAYWAGFKAGHDSAHIPLSQRPAMHARCDAEIAANHYDKDSYDSGFVAGTAEADKENPN